MESADIVAEILRNLRPLAAFRLRVLNKASAVAWAKHLLLAHHRTNIADYRTASVDLLLVQSAKTDDVDLCRFSLLRGAVTWQKAFDLAIKRVHLNVAKEIYAFAMRDANEMAEKIVDMQNRGEIITNHHLIVHAEYRQKLDVNIVTAIKSNSMECFRYVFSLVGDRSGLRPFLKCHCDNLGSMLEYALEHGNMIDEIQAETLFAIGVSYKSEKIMAAANAAGAPEKSALYFFAACRICDVEWAKRWEYDTDDVNWHYLITVLKADKRDRRKVRDMLSYLTTLVPCSPLVLNALVKIRLIDRDTVDTTTAEQAINVALRRSDAVAIQRCLALGAVVTPRVMHKFLRSKLARTKGGVQILNLLLEKMAKDIIRQQGAQFLVACVRNRVAAEIVQPFAHYFVPDIYDAIKLASIKKWAQIQPICEWLRQAIPDNYWIDMALSTRDTEAYDYVLKHCRVDDLPTLFSYKPTYVCDIRRWFDRFDPQKS